MKQFAIWLVLVAATSSGCASVDSTETEVVRLPDDWAETLNVPNPEPHSHWFAVREDVIVGCLR